MNHRAQRDQQLRRQQELVSAARAESRELTAEEQAEFDRCQREIERLNPLVEAEDRQAAAGAAQTTPAAGAATGTPPPPMTRSEPSKRNAPAFPRSRPFVVNSTWIPRATSTTVRPWTRSARPF